MLKLFIVLLVSGVIFVGIDSFQKYGRELQCYQCNSLTVPNCIDFFDNMTMNLERCPDDGRNYTRCRKVVQEIYYDGTWEKRYYRDCAVTGDIGAEEGRWCTDRMGTLRVKVRYCHCDNKQGCNTAAMATVTPIAVIMSVVILFWTYHPC